MIWPSTRLFTLTVLMACTVPMPSAKTGTSCAFATSAATGMARLGGGGASERADRWPISTQPAALAPTATAATATKRRIRILVFPDTIRDPARAVGGQHSRSRGEWHDEAQSVDPPTLADAPGQ